MSADMEFRFRVGAKFCSVAAMVLLVIVALCPADWLVLLRTGYWATEHFLAFFAVTSIVCLAWPRPFVVGGALMVVAALLEALQGLTPDRTPNLMGAFWGAVGALAAAARRKIRRPNPIQMHCGLKYKAAQFPCSLRKSRRDLQEGSAHLILV
jgi:hypothetical protein